MEFPPEEVCPRIMLSDELIYEGELYIFYSTIRGLYDKDLISKAKMLDLIGADDEEPVTYIEGLNLKRKFNLKEFWESKRIGLQGEMAFHISRGADPTTPFDVARCYAFRRGFEKVYPDACLGPSESVRSFCKDSKMIDVKTRRRQEYNARVGLNIKNEWWITHSHDDFYVAVSQRKRHNPPYDVLDYAVLGYAFKEEIDDTLPRFRKKVDLKRGYRFIHYYDLHPIELLTPSSYETSVTVRDRLV